MSILMAAAVIPAIVLMVVVYREDKIEKEPKGLIFKIFCLGIIAVLPTMVVEIVLGNVLVSAVSTDSVLYVFLENFFGVALVEEFFKYKATKIGSWKSVEFNYVFDAIVYSVASAMGFAAFENILYAMQYGLGNTLFRAVTAIPGHCTFGVFMGIYYGMAKYYAANGYAGKSRALRMKAVLVPMVIHGFYDFCCSMNAAVYTYVFFAFIIVMDIIAIKRVRRASREDQQI